MKLNDIVVLKNGLNSFYLVLEMEKHLFEIVEIVGDVAIIKSLSTGVEIRHELESIRLATLKEKYLRDGNVVELNNGNVFLIHKDRMVKIDGFVPVKIYDDNLKAISYSNVIKVYKYDSENYGSINKMLEIGDYHKVIWQRRIELTDDEKVILRNLDNEYKYINREKSGSLLVTSEKGSVFGHSHYINIYKHLFKSITHESGIHEIKELLK